MNNTIVIIIIVTIVIVAVSVAVYSGRDVIVNKIKSMTVPSLDTPKIDINPNLSEIFEHEKLPQIKPYQPQSFGVPGNDNYFLGVDFVSQIDEEQERLQIPNYTENNLFLGTVELQDARFDDSDVEVPDQMDGTNLHSIS